MRTAVILAIAVTGVICVSVRGQPAKPPGGLEKARLEYKLAIEKVQVDYKAAAKLATAEQKKRLAELLEVETKGGNLDGALQIRDEIKGLDVEGLPVLPDQPGLVGKAKVMPGTWTITYHPIRLVRTYVVQANGEVFFKEENRKGQLKLTGESFELDFGDGKFERVTFAGGRLFSELFEPKANVAQNVPSQIGVGGRGNRHP